MEQQSISVYNKTTLIAKFDVNAKSHDEIFFYRGPHHNHALTKLEVEETLLKRDVYVINQSDKADCGLFAIGPLKENHLKFYNWYYSYDYPVCNTPELLEASIYKLLAFALTGASLAVNLTLENDTGSSLRKTDTGKENPYYQYFPETIKAYDFANIQLTNNTDDFDLSDEINFTISYTNMQDENTLGEIVIRIQKTFDQLKSSIKITPLKQLLMGSINLLENSISHLSAQLTIAENRIFSTFNNVQEFLIAVNSRVSCEQVNTPGISLGNILNYNKARQVYNTRIQATPFAIVYCQNTEDVATVYALAKQYKLAIRVRSGGHDHEGESVDTDTIVIDLSKMNHFELDNKTGIATIGPGNRFQKLTTDLANRGVMIPHGTSPSIGIGGFILGGGWGPWTRSKGMCCEYILEATLILGDGKIKTINHEGSIADKELLWALKGGGGFSYGIVTELKIQTFPLAKELIQFELEWNPYIPNDEHNLLEIQTDKPSIAIIKNWVEVIKAENLNQQDQLLNQALVGTNLKLSTIPDHGSVVNGMYHNTTMYGYWEGNKKSLIRFIETNFGSERIGQYKLTLTETTSIKNNTSYGAGLMPHWNRESHHQVKGLLSKQTLPNQTKGNLLAPDYDKPAPHKITSRLVDKEGLNEEGYQALLQSLTSPLIMEGNRELGLFSYVTLGAINGAFYQDNSHQDPDRCAFPYTDKQYIIQYQTWWHESFSDKETGPNNIYSRVNRALDWIQWVRDIHIPNTSGAFISFKDDSIPTRTYFAENYQKLTQIKADYCADPNNQLSTRKTII